MRRSDGVVRKRCENKVWLQVRTSHNMVFKQKKNQIKSVLHDAKLGAD